MVVNGGTINFYGKFHNMKLTMGEYVFYKCELDVIYCEVGSKPSGWSTKWYYSDNPFLYPDPVWGYKIEE